MALLKTKMVGQEWIFRQFSVILSCKKHTIYWRDRTATHNDLVQSAIQIIETV